MRTFFLLLIILSLSSRVSAQTDSSALRTSTLRGAIKSAVTGLPIAGARIKIQKTKLGAVSSIEGAYRIDRVPVGHYLVTVTSQDYASQTEDIIIGSAHQAVLDFSLDDRRMGSDDTLTVSGSLALTPINRYAAVSVTPFSIEDVNRYAAAFQDPSRMAENFAGVFGRGSMNNYIVVRGGSPIELLWRLDNIDIPDPNHFGRNGTSGGLISAINSATLGNSDFLSGAFPAEYGGKLSAVFDLHTRNGNTETHEGRAEISFNGLEALVEGPVPGANNSSYLFGYRHSTLGFLKTLGILNYSTLPDFDDASLKLHFPIGQRDQLNLTGLWGTASLDAQYTANDEIGAGSGIDVGGIDWQHLYSDAWLGHLYLNYVRNRYDEGYGAAGKGETTTAYSTAKSTLTYTPNESHSIQFGASAQRGNFGYHNPGGSGFDTAVHSNFYTAFVNWNWHVVPQLSLNAGLYSQFISYDSSSSYEPRVSLAWEPNSVHSFSLAFGVHRQPEPVRFTQSLHYVAGYTLRPEDDLLFKAEAYLKQYSDVPVHVNERDFYSYLNEGFANVLQVTDLVNSGKGRTYGAELTALKHYSSGYFVTGTASFVRQQFAGSDNVWHFGTFDNIYILNLVTGFDIALSPSSTLTLGEKFTIAGGGMYTPFDLARSQQLYREVLDSANAYSQRNDPYVRLDLNVDLRFNWRASSLTIFMSILNALNIKNLTYRHLDFQYDSSPVETYDYDLERLPIAGIRYEF